MIQDSRWLLTSHMSTKNSQRWASVQVRWILESTQRVLLTAGCLWQSFKMGLFYLFFYISEQNGRQALPPRFEVLEGSWRLSVTSLKTNHLRLRIFKGSHGSFANNVCVFFQYPINTTHKDLMSGVDGILKKNTLCWQMKHRNESRREREDGTWEVSGKPAVPEFATSLLHNNGNWQRTVF